MNDGLKRMRNLKKIMLCSALMSLCCLLFSVPAFSQESTPEPLRLSEVVITGIDQTKIHRQLPKVIPRLALTEVAVSSRELSEDVMQEGTRYSLTQPQEAKERYVQAVRLDPGNSRAYLLLGDMYAKLEEYSLAAEAYGKGTELAQEGAEIHYKLGILYEDHLKETQKAANQYRTYLQLGGVDARVQIWLRNLEQH